MTYHNLESILGIRWLANHPDHSFNQWAMKPNDSKEKLLLSRFDTYVGKVITSSHAPKKFRKKIRNQFVDTFSELEVGCSLIEKGFKVNFEKILKGIRSDLTPDLFIENDNVIVEVKTLHQSAEVEKGRKSLRVFKYNEHKRIMDDLLNELGKYGEQEIEHPLIVVVCPCIIEEPIASQDDFEEVLYYQVSRMYICGALSSRSTKVESKGLYSSIYGEAPAILSGVGFWMWIRKDMVFYRNPNVNATSKIPQGNFLDYLQSRENTKLFRKPK